MKPRWLERKMRHDEVERWRNEISDRRERATRNGSFENDGDTVDTRGEQIK
jgi:hypothetical protein